MRQYPEDDVFNRALLLENHPRQVQKHLVPLHFQLRFFVQVRVSETDPAELEVTGEDLFVLLREGGVSYFVDDLKGR